MNILKRMSCAALAALMLLSCVACASNDENDGVETSTAGTKTDETVASTEKLEIPDTNYGDIELTFLTRDESEWSTIEIYAEEEDRNNDTITNAVYERNTIIAEKYGVTIKELKALPADMISKVQKENAAPTGEFKAVISSATNAASMAQNGYLWDLNAEGTAYIDFSKSWWDSALAEGIAINDHVYFATGDLLTRDNDATFVLMFNKTIADEVDVPNLYDMVENKEWTMERLYEYSQLPVHDADGNGRLDYKTERAGLAFTDDSYYAIYYGGGCTITTLDPETDMPIYQVDVARMSSICEWSLKIFNSKTTFSINDIYNSDQSVTVMKIGQDAFGGGNALFMAECLQCVERMRGFDISFGVLPYPLLDEEQDQYYHMMHLTGNVVSIPKAVNESDIEMVSAMLEALACYSQSTLTVEYYEKNLTSKYVDDPESAPMIDLILATRVFDRAYYFSWGSAPGNFALTMKPGSTTAGSVSSVDRQMKSAVQNAITQTIRAMERMDKSN